VFLPRWRKRTSAVVVLRTEASLMEREAAKMGLEGRRGAVGDGTLVEAAAGAK
jgi:hypothetical protein